MSRYRLLLQVEHQPVHRLHLLALGQQLHAQVRFHHVINRLCRLALRSYRMAARALHRSEEIQQQVVLLLVRLPDFGGFLRRTALGDNVRQLPVVTLEVRKSGSVHVKCLYGSRINIRNDLSCEISKFGVVEFGQTDVC